MRTVIHILLFSNFLQLAVSEDEENALLDVPDMDPVEISAQSELRESTPVLQRERIPPVTIKTASTPKVRSYHDESDEELLS